MCFDPGDGKPLFLSDTDQSSPLIACYRVDELEDWTRIAYYTTKVLKWLGTRVPPP